MLGTELIILLVGALTRVSQPVAYQFYTLPPSMNILPPLLFSCDTSSVKDILRDVRELTGRKLFRFLFIMTYIPPSLRFADVSPFYFSTRD